MVNLKEILEILSPYCIESNGILGRDDLNNLLTQYPEIERQHFKLWLTPSVHSNGAPRRPVRFYRLSANCQPTIEKLVAGGI